MIIVVFCVMIIKIHAAFLTQHDLFLPSKILYMWNSFVHPLPLVNLVSFIND